MSFIVKISIDLNDLINMTLPLPPLPFYVSSYPSHFHLSCTLHSFLSPFSLSFFSPFSLSYLSPISPFSLSHLSLHFSLPFLLGSEPMSDAVIFEPIPYRSALRENCTHIIAVRTRAGKYATLNSTLLYFYF